MRRYNSRGTVDTQTRTPPKAKHADLEAGVRTFKRISPQPAFPRAGCCSIRARQRGCFSGTPAYALFYHTSELLNSAAPSSEFRTTMVDRYVRLLTDVVYVYIHVFVTHGHSIRKPLKLSTFESLCAVCRSLVAAAVSLQCRNSSCTGRVQDREHIIIGYRAVVQLQQQRYHHISHCCERTQSFVSG